MRSLLHCLTGIAALLIAFLGWMPLAEAHPLGNFTINHYAGLQVMQDSVKVDYVLDMAEIPAFQEIRRLDTNGDRKADPTETVTYPGVKCQEINSYLDLRVDQRPAVLALNHATVDFPPGVGGLATVRLTCTFEAAIASNRNHSVNFEDASYPQRLGWREITVVGNGVPIQGDFTTTSITKRLTDYPTELLSSPLNQVQVAFEITPSMPVAESATLPAGPATHPLGQALAGRQNDAFTRLITLENLNLPTVLIALAIAFVWGGVHALSPGHGKTVVGAYLVGSRSKFHHAVFLGLTVTLTHTVGVFALGLLTLGTSHLVPMEQVYPWLSLLSGGLVVAIGLNLLINRLRNLEVFQKWIAPAGYATLAYAHVHQAMDHHSHSAHDHSHDHHHGHHHSHDHHSHTQGHSHLPPGADGSPITWISILALGISGGLLPCPSALVVLLSAIAVGRIGFGLALVSAFSLGLAGVLTAIGLTLVYAKQWFERLPLQSTNSKLFPALSAALITLMGIGITTQALFVRTL